MSERVRGFATWEPRAKSRVLLDQVHAVLAEYAAHLPLTIRQVFYRLVGGHGYDKTELAYDRLGELLNRARRAGLIDFDAIRDGGVTALQPRAFAGPQGFVLEVRRLAADYRLDRQHGQQRHLELWVEAAGMTQMLFQAVGSYGVPVHSCGGFDSLTAKHKAARRIAGRHVPTLVLHVGDHDPSGLALFQAASSDVQAMAAQLGGEVEFERVAVTPEQITRHGLPTAPAKPHDKRSAWVGGGTVQAEALPPDVLVAEVRQAVVSQIDPEALVEVRRREAAEGWQIVSAVDALLDNEEGAPS